MNEENIMYQSINNKQTNKQTKTTTKRRRKKEKKKKKARKKEEKEEEKSPVTTGDKQTKIALTTKALSNFVSRRLMFSLPAYGCLLLENSYFIQPHHAPCWKCRPF